MKNVIGLIHPESARHHRSKVLCNNPDVVITRVEPYVSKPGWFIGDFTPLRDVGHFKAGVPTLVCGFRPRRMKVRG